MKIKLDMSESDIIRAMKNNRHSPVDLLAAKYFKEDPENVESDYDCIVIWDDSINDYNSYRYCTEDINSIKDFLDQWFDYSDGYLVDFALTPISFCVEENG
jgi:antitoxin component HigA of HigAB toxin-antitoxin module